MKSLFALILILMTASASASNKFSSYCNVFIGTACFGMKSGDEYKYTSQVDFSIYEIKLSSRDKINIYSGYHPASFDYAGAYFSKETVNGYLVSALKIDNQHHRILIESMDKRVPSVDINISIFSGDKRLITEFIKSFRSCTITQLEAACKDDILLQSVVL
ncbi:hypothetical protein PSI9734_00350 [Pseudidiomarina piscicola]|uniref:Uncharacterized protein n=1 Tax=Pseudidiomarina piscicola TaxID=2614830 RepID=A0A6S6WTD0_9GAMM|nr:hypothetical protein [Pseudidiomarina piscicola]CAB0149769.1 hypothetical protein PSI9734_00350 [Pseudidiomarina piscicola]VZT39218.1 hypothetical protein PSI9734_00350 [Pseudomonas aeruginosa]